MGWLKKSSDGPVTVAFLQERNVTLDWQEGVALVLEVAEVFKRSGKRSVPRLENIAVTPRGRSSSYVAAPNRVTRCRPWRGR